MNISSAAEATGLTPKTIRYYESIGLVSPASRRDNGYRDYDDQHVRELLFISQARELGFSLEECGELLNLYKDKGRKSADVKAIAHARIEDIDQKISRLQTVRESLQQLVTCCHGDERPDCPILDSLAGEQKN
ncbi:Cu(I)-responsive transcriptional regulator [Sansalvadorimonas sp. 2012CJ34-2]|uniref:HTH-type transcriptional regulator CueR n=1 Tax=Parendozoicomonas callyspongiae TaxID=2942213 RepID=A0ABT0PJM8_9GAMM|nr:Cu(I)-responsive transcriptional regulator [Sansalvadorimonas sp. 2012CJ34-2]MCL6271538.1 Cu(I)-responsive transcriptional regulator [Sansalvadorimonas sp. 2012CJ34-2]